MNKLEFSFFLWVGSLLVSGQWGEARALARNTLTDESEKLVLEFSPGIQLIRDSSGAYLRCRGCGSEELEGAPQLPYLDFQVIAGRGEPAVGVEVFDTHRAVLEQGLPPVPGSDSLGNPLYRKDAGLYREAAALKPRVGPVRYLRGYPVRRIAVPLVKWNEEARTAEWMDRLRVTVRFPNPASSPVPIGLPGHMQSQLANPKGGGYQMEPSVGGLPKPSSGFREKLRTPRGLEPTDAAPKGQTTRNDVRLSGPVPLPLVKIAVGDSTVESLSEDGVYEISYSKLEAALPVTFMREEVIGASVEDLHVYTGVGTQLQVEPDSLPIAPNLREIPVEVLDNNDNGAFDDGDALRFFGHGTSTWIPRESNDSLPFLYTYETGGQLRGGRYGGSSHLRHRLPESPNLQPGI